MPRAALVMTRSDEPALYVVEGGVARRKPVSLGDGDNQSVIVQTGLASGEKLVIEGQNVLKDSVKVKVL